MSNGTAAAEVKRRAPPPPPRKDSEIRLSSNSNFSWRSSSPNGAPQVDASTTASAGTSQKAEVPKFLGVQLVELVRVGTKAPHLTCVNVAAQFLSLLCDELPNSQLSQLVREVEQQIKRSESQSETWSAADVLGLLERSDDAARFRHVISALAKHCRSEQQHRSTYFDDDDELLNALSELKTVCADADRRIVQFCIGEDDYAALQTLSTLFCVDTRAEVRTHLIDALLHVIRTDQKTVTILLESSFAFELARQFAELTFEQQSPGSRLSRLGDLIACRAKSALAQRLVRMLTALFATGEQLPVALTDYLNVDFIISCLRKLEAITNGGGEVNTEARLSLCKCEAAAEDDDLAELLFTMLISFNLHFTELRTNVLIAAMRGAAADTRTFTEKLLSHFNALDDPVERYRPAATFRPFRTDSVTTAHANDTSRFAYRNAVIKTLSDCYADAICADLFYTNDAKALVDILLRFVVDLNAGDSIRNEVLSLTLLVVRSSAFAEHRHRLGELRESVTFAGAAEPPSNPTGTYGDAEEKRERIRRDREIAIQIVEELDRINSL